MDFWGLFHPQSLQRSKAELSPPWAGRGTMFMSAMNQPQHPQKEILFCFGDLYYVCIRGKCRMKNYSSWHTTKQISLCLRSFSFLYAFKLGQFKTSQSVSRLENVPAMRDESKTTLCMSNCQNFSGGCKRDLQKQVLHSWDKVLQKYGGSAWGESTFTYYKWGLYKLCVAAALQNHNTSLSLDQITITIME